jgi:negative regulator of replication initiation
MKVRWTAKVGLMRFIADPVFVGQNATEKFLGILGFAAKDRAETFGRVLNIPGRKRKWFGATSEEIELSGKSTYPRRIPKFRVLGNDECVYG